MTAVSAVDSDRTIVLVQFEPAFALHAYLRRSNIKYVAENSLFTSFMSGALPAAVMPNEFFINGNDDIFRVLNKRDVSAVGSFAACASELLVRELTNVLLTIPAVKMMTFRLSRNIVAFDFGWLRLVESCDSYYECCKRGNIVTSDASDAELLNSKLLKLHSLYLEIEDVLRSLPVYCSPGQSSVSDLLNNNQWSLTCDAWLFDHVMKLILYATKEFVEEPAVTVNEVYRKSDGTRCICQELFYFLHSRCPNVTRRVELVASLCFSNYMGDCSALESNRFISSSINHRLLSRYLSLKGVATGASSDCAAIVTCSSSVSDSVVSISGFSEPLCQFPEYRLDLSLTSLIDPIYSACALLNESWKSLMMFALHRRSLLNDSSAVDSSKDLSLQADITSLSYPAISENAGDISVLASSAPVVCIRFWDVLFGGLVLGSFVGFGLSRP